MRYRAVHHTEYRYMQPVALCHNETHLRPRAVAHQRCLSHALVIDPEPDLISEREDFFGNPTASFSMQRGHSHLSVTATSEVEVGSPKRPGQVPDVPWEEAAEILR
ncbi:MAG: transglutaminase family protein, partial [Gammaproteobacteria bacterium]|nr:transglutaminase family protein [Gammaproteobacteria bacterium]